MPGLRRLHRYTYAEYVAFESVSAEKHEFLDGQIYALTAHSEEHSALSAAMVRLLGNAAGERGCRVHTSDLRVHVESAGLATYPDASVICGPLAQHEPSPKATALNPVILVEVTSDSSEEYDTGAKLEYYQSIPTLREYVIVSHRQRRVTVHARGSDGTWTVNSADSGGEVAIASLDARLAIDDIYRNSSIT